MRISKRKRITKFAEAYSLHDRCINGTWYQFSADRQSIRVSRVDNGDLVHSFKRKEAAA